MGNWRPARVAHGKIPDRTSSKESRTRLHPIFLAAITAIAASPIACVVNQSSPGGSGPGGHAGTTGSGGSAGNAQDGGGGSAQDGGGGTQDGSACTTLDQDITTDTTLPAGCYRLTADITVTATLTLDPGVTITSNASDGIQIGDSREKGSLVAVGTASQPIIMQSNGQAGNWNGLSFDGSTSGSLEYVTITDGGRQGNSGDLSLDGSSQVDVKHCTFKNSKDDGIWIDPAAVLTRFADNTMTGNQNDPVELYADNVGMLDSASHHTGNGHDRVEFTGTFDAPATVHALDVHY